MCFVYCVKLTLIVHLVVWVVSPSSEIALVQIANSRYHLLSPCLLDACYSPRHFKPTSDPYNSASVVG